MNFQNSLFFNKNLKIMKIKICTICYTLLIVITISLITSCKKDEATSTDHSLIGKYELISNAPYTQEYKYLIFNENKIYSLSLTDNNFRSMYVVNYRVSGNTILCDGVSVTYSLTDNILTFYYENGETIYKRNNNLQINTEWVKYITPLVEYEFNNKGISDICYYNNSIWIPGDGIIYRYDPALNSIIDSISVIDSVGLSLGNIGAVTSAINMLWIPSKYGLLSLDPNTGHLISTHSGMPLCGIITYDNHYMWGYRSDYGSFYKYDIYTNTLLQEFYVSDYWGSSSGLAFAKGYYYFCVHGVIHKCTFEPFQVISAYSFNPATSTSSFFYINGIAYDGTNFWVITVRGTKRGLAKVNLP